MTSPPVHAAYHTYTFGVSNFVGDKFWIGNRTFITDDVQHLSAVMLHLGLAL